MLLQGYFLTVYAINNILGKTKMRFKLTFEKIHSGQDAVIPINYQYELSSWIYKVIHKGNPEFANWLHDKGYCDGKKTFKFFTFSTITAYPYQIKGDRFIIKDSKAQLIISFYLEETAEPFIIGLFKEQVFGLGDKKSQADFRITGVERIADPELQTTMRFRLVTPLVLGVKESDQARHVSYIEPNHADYKRQFFFNLVSKHKTLLLNNAKVLPLNEEELNNCDLKLLNTPHSKLIKIKANTPQETQVRGYVFDFEITAPLALIEIGFGSGFGEKNSAGFGFGEI